MIRFAGDSHGLLSHLSGQGGQPLIHVGDLSPLSGPLEDALPDELIDQFWFIPGNHDLDHAFDRKRLLESPLGKERNLHGRVAVIDGRRVAGLGGIFKERLWYPNEVMSEPKFVSREAYLDANNPRKRILSEKVIPAIWPEDYEALSRQQADILVTHEAPSSHPMGFVAIDRLAKAMGARLIVHGHHHEYYTAVLPDSQIRVISVGYRDVVDERGDVVYRHVPPDPGGPAF